VRRQIVDRFGELAFKQISDEEKELLRLPFLLAFALQTDAPPQQSSTFEALEHLFVNLIGLSGTELDQLADAAFEVYRVRQSRVFPASDLTDKVSERIWNLVIEAEVVHFDRKSGQAQFDHQLEHDYLAAKHIVSARATEWTRTTFDTATFGGTSHDVLLMVAERLRPTEALELFLQAVYDWNWSASVECLARGGAADPDVYDSATGTALLCEVGEKLFDPFELSRDVAKTLLAGFPRQIRETYQRSSTADLAAYSRQLSANASWYARWRELMSLVPPERLEYKHILATIERNPLVGWTAANAIRRFDLADADIRQLITIYDMSVTDRVVRWRVVHSLGQTQTGDVVRFLFRAVDEDEDQYVCYGAARSLIEIAGFTDSSELRRRVVSGFIERARSVRGWVLERIAARTRLRSVPDSWCEDVAPLLEIVRDAQESSSARERWEHYIDAFKKEFCS
jgi:hypothetical protein